MAREAAWLRTTGDGLPELLAPNGPWEVIQGYDPRTPYKQKTTIFVMRQQMRVTRRGSVRSIADYSFHLKLFWPLTLGTGSAETAMQDFDDAIDALVGRVLGVTPGLNGSPAGDKTHGGRFLSVAEQPEYLTVVFDDPSETFANTKTYSASMTYLADDFEIIN